VLLLLPYIAEQYFLPKIIDGLPFANKEMSLSRISPWKIRGTFSAEENGQNAIIVPKFEIHYTPVDLLKGKISHLLIDSAAIHLEKRAGKLGIRGMREKNLRAGKAAVSTMPALPVWVEKIVIKNSLLALHASDSSRENLNIDGVIHLRFQKSVTGGSVLNGVEGKILTLGALHTITRFATERIEGGHAVSYDTQVADIAALQRVIPQLQRFDIQGKASVVGSLQTAGINILREFKTEIKLGEFHLGKDNLVLKNKGVKEPLLVKLQGTPEKVEFEVSQALLSKPEGCPFSLTGEYWIPQQTFSGKAVFLPDRTAAKLSVDFKGTNVASRINTSYLIKGEPFSLTDSLFIGGQTAEGEMELSNGTISAKLSGRISKIKEKELVLRGISLDLPFNYPALAHGVTIPGSLVINEIEYNKVSRGTLKASVTVSHDQLLLNSLLTTPMSSDFKLTCSGSAKLQRDLRVNCFLPEFAIDQEVVAPFVSLPEGLAFSGNIAAEGRLTMVGNALSGDATVSYSDGNVDYNEHKLSNIAINLTFPDLPRIQSKPSQLATIGTLNLGKVKMSDAKIKFRVDDLFSIFIEGAQLSWCDGRVEMGGLKLYKNMESLDTILYCDRLGYTELLNQFGIGDAEGEGSLNGRLPLFISKEGVRFDDGFLFSTPGNSGIVRFKDTDQLRQGIPSINQAAYLDYSLNALENFSYNWTKLTFNTEQEHLLLSLQLDGKPAEPLPYGYKEGQIVKTETGSGLQHPIRLDVNFRLPLNDLFRYGNNIQSIMENM